MPQTTKRRSKPPRAAATAAAFAGLASASVMPASASAIQEAYYAHTRVCVSLLFNDKPAHTLQCLPNNSPSTPAHDGGGGGNLPVVAPPVVVAAPVVVAPVVAPPVVAPPVVEPPVVAPPVVEPPPPPVAEPDPEVDSSYPDDA